MNIQELVMSSHNRGEAHSQSGKIDSSFLVVIAFALGAATIAINLFWGAWTWQSAISGPNERSYISDLEFQFYEWGPAEPVTLVDHKDMIVPINGLFTDEDFDSLYLIETVNGKTQVQTPVGNDSSLEESYSHTGTEPIYADFWNGEWTISKSFFTDSSEYYPVESYLYIAYDKRNNRIFLGLLCLIMAIYGAKAIFSSKTQN